MEANLRTAGSEEGGENCFQYLFSGFSATWQAVSTANKLALRVSNWEHSDDASYCTAKAIMNASWVSVYDCDSTINLTAKAGKLRHSEAEFARLAGSTAVSLSPRVSLLPNMCLEGY